jgi:hypothetical protein
MDGLSAVSPYADKDYAGRRVGRLAGPGAEAEAADGDEALVLRAALA